MTDALDAQHLNGLRRTRSTSDIPRLPDPTYIPGSPAHSRSPSDIVDHLPNEPRSSPAHRRQFTRVHLEHGRRSPPLAVSLEYPQTRTLGRHASMHSPRASHDEDNVGSLAPEHVPPRSLYRRVMFNLGFGRGASRERRSLVGLILNLVSGSSQIIIVTVILALSGTRFKSPTIPELTEWQACSRPLGPWACIWVFRAVLASSLNYWGFLRERHMLARRRTESGTRESRDETHRNPSMRASNDTAQNSPRIMESGEPTPLRDHPSMPHTILYSRLTLLSSLLTLTWFLTAHILEYTSINTCRHSSPHIWWLTFGILCLMYLMVLEVVILGFVVFVVAPVLFLFWNIVLICMGRHPLQTHNTIKPDIGKLPKSIVETIPLVMYIPPPPDSMQQHKTSVPSLPSSPSELSVSQPKERFKFIKQLRSSRNIKNEKGSASETRDVEKEGEPQTWEEHWERGEYPFVILEENRAACAICLLDFEEPKRIWGHSKPTDLKAEDTTSESGSGSAAPMDPHDSQTTLRHDTTLATSFQHNAGSGKTLQLEDAGQGSQPLRLLACGHVFHKTCLDPWLLDISGRCPVCQRVVEATPDTKNRKGRRPTRNR